MFEVTTEIARPPSEVFAYLARITDAPQWYSAVESVEPYDADPVQLGTRARFRRQLGGATVENEVEVSAFEPDRQFELSSVSGPTPFVYRYRLDPSGGGTRLRLEGQISGEGLSGPLALFKPFAETFFKRGMATNLKTLKRLIENG
jgi:uncharacterized membrane protein